MIQISNIYIIMVKASELIKEQENRDKQKIIIYKKIYKRIENKILKSSHMNLYECWYEIPEFLFNIPLYNLDKCKIYLKKKLTDDGFVVTFSGVNVIIISWSH